MEHQIREEVEVMTLRARSEAARWRAEARQAELDARMLQRERDEQSRKLDELHLNNQKLIAEVSDSDLKKTMILQQRLLDLMRQRSNSARTALEVVESLDAPFRDMFAKQSDAAARKISRIKWEFSFSHFLRVAFKFLVGFCVLGLLVDAASGFFHLGLFWGLLVAVVAFIVGELYVGRISDSIDEKYCTRRLRQSVICKVAIFEANWRVSEISMRAIKEREVRAAT
ncbi:hypothetical protein [Streptomyces sp. NPDC059649]|uniref:hypothetical protein n=1 Tax=Streptomyces sp. NPDC059649 TaxID=3346895 RepID=UPI0036838242